jgi:hypothetical protein
VTRSALHLIACVASHGWGHLSQTIPMVSALSARLPGLRTTVRTALPAPLVRARFEAVGLPAPEVSADDTDFGFVMHDALFALEPGMPFERFANRLPVPPIARRGVERREALRQALGVPRATRVMQVAFGGMPLVLDTVAWRLPQGWIAVVLTAGASEGPSARCADALGWPYTTCSRPATCWSPSPATAPSPKRGSLGAIRWPCRATTGPRRGT